MRRRELFRGATEPFEGDRTVVVRIIPAGARVTAASLTVTPVAALGRPLFDEIIGLANGAGSWGATQSAGTLPGLHWTEVDFHNRRTVARLQGANLTGGKVQVDLGGLYVELNDRGAVKVPDEGTLLTLASDDSAVPAITAARIKVTGAVEAPRITSLTVRSAPSNLSARLGSRPPFWARPGELSRAETTPDFTAALQEALASAPVDAGYHHVPLTIHSDTIARVDVEMNVEFVVEQRVLPGGLNESTLVYDHGSLPKAGGPTLTVAVPAGARLVPSSRRARAVGAFEASRVVHGPTGEVAVTGMLAMEQGESLARPVSVPTDLPVTSLDILVGVVSRTATLHVNVFDDADGKPWNEPLLLRPVVISLDRDLGEGERWVNAELPAEFQFAAGKRYWLVVQCLAGKVTWAVRAGSAGIPVQRITDAGLAWRAATVTGAEPAETLFRLRSVPPVFTMPIEVQVGAGEAATRVSLARFAPLGRVDIDLGADEVLGAINTHVATVGTHACPRGDQLRDGRFAHWRRTADLPRETDEPREISIGFSPLRIVVSADGCSAFALGAAGTELGSTLQVRRIDVFQDLAVSGPVVPGTHTLVDAAAAPDGSRVYALVDGTQVIVVTDDATRVPQVVPVPRGGATALALSSDGTTLYVAGAPVVNEGVGVEYYVVAIDTATMTPTRTVDLGFPPVALALSPDGATLHVLTSVGVLLAVDAAAFLLRPGVVQVPSGGQRFAITPDGASAVLLDPMNSRLALVRLSTGKTGWVELGLVPTAVALAPGGRYAYVAGDGAESLVIVDLEVRSVRQRRAVGADPLDVAVTPGGERVYVATIVNSSLEAIPVLPVGTLVPEEWSVTAGRVRPLCGPHPRVGRQVAIGATIADEPTATAALAQVVPVSGGCRYELSFAGVATDEGATAEVHWIGTGSERLRTDVTEIQASGASSAGVNTAQGFLPELRPHRASFDSPDGATQAEVRFTAPVTVLARVADASLEASHNRLANARLTLDADDLLSGWTVTPPHPVHLAATAAEGQLHLFNGGTATVALSQVVAAEAGRTYRLAADAAARPASSAEARAEVAWRDGADGPVGSPAGVALSRNTSGPQALVAVSPPGTEAAEVRLVLPAGAAVDVRQVALEAVETVEVPLTFVAESPGELTISGWHVAFDVDEAPSAPPAPSQGLCHPGRPDLVPGEQPSDAHCPTCEEKHELRDPKPAHTQSGRPAVVGTCANCGADVLLAGGTEPTGGGPLRVSRTHH